MGGQYYLVSQLPAFSINQSAPLPVTEEYFIDLCSRFMDKKAVKAIQNLSLEPPRQAEKTGYDVLDKVAGVKASSNGTPDVDVIIESITLDTY